MIPARKNSVWQTQPRFALWFDMRVNGITGNNPQQNSQCQCAQPEVDKPGHFPEQHSGGGQNPARQSPEAVSATSVLLCSGLFGFDMTFRHK